MVFAPSADSRTVGHQGVDTSAIEVCNTEALVALCYRAMLSRDQIVGELGKREESFVSFSESPHRYIVDCNSTVLSLDIRGLG